MRRIIWIGLALAGAASVAAACGDESPTEVGSDLLGEELRTVQVVLDASDFLMGDTAYDGIGKLNDATYSLLANAYGGDTDAHVFFQVTRPDRVSYTNSDGDAISADTIASVAGSTLVLVLDTLTGEVGPVDVEVVALTEDWDPATVSWDLRIDSTGVTEAWTTPGGTTGTVLGTGTWSSGDTVRVELDSAATAVLDDSTRALSGAMIRLATAGKRVRVTSLDFDFNVIPQSTPDTILLAGRMTEHEMVSPVPPDPAPGTIRVGGLPVWRSLLHFTSLADLMVPCETGSTTCEIPLSEVTVNRADLLLRTQAMDGRRTERGMQVEARAVLEGPTVPLSRAPLSRPFGAMADTLKTSSFEAPAGTLFRIPITGFVERNAAVSGDDVPLLWMALVATSERARFGYAEFAGVGSANPPQMELTVTIPVRKVNP